ncbi:hypothetical protein, partial [Enterobacter kobei]|uniref:hypothetical protein n=1 Tax=Enterobacter kobei TaxID=208224 RepID=UPI0013D688DF
MIIAALTPLTLLLVFYVLRHFPGSKIKGLAAPITRLRSLPFLFGALVSIPFVSSEFLDVMFFPGAWM